VRGPGWLRGGGAGGGLVGAASGVKRSPPSPLGRRGKRYRLGQKLPNAKGPQRRKRLRALGERSPRYCLPTGLPCQAGVFHSE
jgi:hypothetical protein